jgi:hypothetical protein
MSPKTMEEMKTEVIALAATRSDLRWASYVERRPPTDGETEAQRRMTREIDELCREILEAGED